MGAEIENSQKKLKKKRKKKNVSSLENQSEISESAVEMKMNVLSPVNQLEDSQQEVKKKRKKKNASSRENQSENCESTVEMKKNAPSHSPISQLEDSEQKMKKNRKKKIATHETQSENCESTAEMKKNVQSPENQSSNCESSVKKRGAKKRKFSSINLNESSDEEVQVKKKKVMALESSDEDDQSSTQTNKNHEQESDSEPKEEKPSVCTPRAKRFADSSDDEAPTPKMRRLSQLKRMAEIVNKKKSRQIIDFFDEEAGDQKPFDSDMSDEENYPMFEHEDEPPDSADDEKRAEPGTTKEESEEDDDSFLDDGDVEEGEGEENDLDDDSGEDDIDTDEEDGDANSNEESGSEIDNCYSNPYLDSRKEDLGDMYSSAIKSLSKSTAEDKANKKKYKEQMGKYQFAVHSLKNKALSVDKRVRYKRNMKVANFDKGLKDIRNLNPEDEEFFNTQEVGLYGEKIQIHPHTKMRSKKGGRCDLTACGRTFVPYDSKIVGAKIFDPFNLAYMKKRTVFGKEASHWICRSHMLHDADSESEEELSE